MAFLPKKVYALLIVANLAATSASPSNPAPTGGWFVGDGVFTSCDSTCSDAGGFCDEDAFAANNNDVDTVDELHAALTSLLGYNPCTAGTSTSWGTATDVPNYAPWGWCYVTDTNRDASTIDCSVDHHHGIRLCYCSEAAGGWTPPSSDGTSDGDPSTGGSSNPGSTLTGDPHLQFAHGGSADFRGKNNTNYALLSAPGMQVSGKTVDTDFLLPHPQLVHGSFFVHADWMVRGTSGKVYAVESDANEIGFTVSEVTTKGLAFIKKLGGANKQWQWAADGIFAMYHGYAPLSVRANGWEVNATRRPIYNHVAGPSRWRFDFVVRPLDGTTQLEAEFGTASKTCFPHGIIGQSWDGDDIAVSGATDDYTFGAAGILKFEMTTKAMAEGAIEGVASDYEVLPHGSGGFKFSRFEESPNSVCAPRNVAKLTGKHSPRAGVATAGSDDSVHEADATSAL